MDALLSQERAIEIINSLISDGTKILKEIRLYKHDYGYSIEQPPNPLLIGLYLEETPFVLNEHLLKNKINLWVQKIDDGLTILFRSSNATLEFSLIDFESTVHTFPRDRLMHLEQVVTSFLEKLLQHLNVFETSSSQLVRFDLDSGQLTYKHYRCFFRLHSAQYLFLKALFHANEEDADADASKSLQFLLNFIQDRPPEDRAALPSKKDVDQIKNLYREINRKTRRCIRFSLITSIQEGKFYKLNLPTP